VRGVSWTRWWGKLNQNKDLPQKRANAEWNVGIFTLTWTCSKIFKSVVNTSNHWCMRKRLSMSTFTRVNLSDFWRPMKLHVAFVFSSFQWLLETGVSLLCHVLKKRTRHQTWKWRLLFVFRVISSSFQKFPSHSPVMSSILPMGATYERVLLSVKLTAGADKASMVRGDISVILG